jgi:hypothetical protein
MNGRFTAVEASLNRAEFRWKGLRFLQRSYVLGILLSLACLFFGGAILLGCVSNKAVAVAFFVVLGAAGMVAWLVILINALAGAPDRRWLASALERVDRRFLDRLNTLLFLENRREARARSFSASPARQRRSSSKRRRRPPLPPAARWATWRCSWPRWG